jgi:hypothetical protein
MYRMLNSLHFALLSPVHITSPSINPYMPSQIHSTVPYIPLSFWNYKAKVHIARILTEDPDGETVWYREVLGLTPSFAQETRIAAKRLDLNRYVMEGTDYTYVDGIWGDELLRKSLWVRVRKQLKGAGKEDVEICVVW